MVPGHCDSLVEGGPLSQRHRREYAADFPHGLRTGECRLPESVTQSLVLADRIKAVLPDLVPYRGHSPTLLLTDYLSQSRSGCTETSSRLREGLQRQRRSRILSFVV